ncbi:MAG TPA: septal ring lytic transglycosylase RlpA family protein [Bryobacteraceae bacterium]|nr:septal ring lytic transglycosylase RlpA family protein [Bryobacteraceae bacterium]
MTGVICFGRASVARLGLGTLASGQMRNFSRWLLVTFCIQLALLISGCGGRKKVRTAKPARIGSHENGIASWYGVPYHGRRAANGEIYNMERLTAAHRTLPFNTWVRVKNLTNDKSIDVRIQDRGPFVDKRIIDLSRAAARAVDMIGPGTAKVRLTVIKPPKHEPVSPPPPPEIIAERPAEPRRTRPTPFPETPAAVSAPPVAVVETELFAVQIGAFQDRSRAEALRVSMEQKYGSARIVLRQGNIALWRVLVGEKASIEEASALAEELRAAGTTGIVVRIDEPASQAEPNRK